MLLKIVLRIVNAVIILLLVVAAGVTYWYFWRPLPRVSGETTAPVSGRVTVVRDRLGEPHIRAATLEDLWFVQGYVTAQDRLWQMDGLRRAAGGDLAEIVGAAAIETDEATRRLRMRRIAEQVVTGMQPDDRAPFAAYARGVNFFIESHQKKLPFEFALLGYDPRPWSVVDSILVSLYMFRDLTTTWPDEVEKRSLLKGGDSTKVNFLFRTRAGTEIAPGGDFQPGSNAWAIAGSHTASGKPLLSNDMHLSFSIPGIWFLVDLESPEMKVAGVSLPGIPGVIVGHNRRIAWGVTNLHYDVQDLYIEKLDTHTGRYEFRGQMRQAREEREQIRVKGRAPVEMRQWVTEHGPVVTDKAGESLALRWVAADSKLAFQNPFLAINRAKNWTEFTTALAGFPGPGQNFVYADVDGNIGYHASGKLPVRHGYSGDVPVDGASGSFEWDGYIPFEQLPSSYNPPNGLIVTGNQNPFGADFPYPVNGNFASPYRSDQIRRMLVKAGNKLRPADGLRVQRDVYSSFGNYLAHALIQAVEKRQPPNADVKRAVDALRGWNGQMEKSLAAPMIIALTYQYFRKAAAESASPGKGTAYDVAFAVAPVERLLRERPAGWFRDFDETLMQCLADAVAEGKRMQGPLVDKWLYGKYTQITIGHPVGHQLPLVATYFDVGPVEMSGSPTTVKQLSKKLGPSMRMNADLGNWENSLLNIVTGESGHVLSKHYKDEWDAYYSGRSFPMQFERVDEKSTAVFMPAH